MIILGALVCFLFNFMNAMIEPIVRIKMSMVSSNNRKSTFIFCKGILYNVIFFTPWYKDKHYYNQHRNKGYSAACAPFI